MKLNYFNYKFLFPLLGISAIGLGGAFYSDFFGLGFVIPIIVMMLVIVSAFMDFYHKGKTGNPNSVAVNKGKGIRGYIEAIPLSFGFLVLLSFQYSLNFAGMRENFDVRYALPPIVDIILIVLAFREFYRIAIDKDPESANKA